MAQNYVNGLFEMTTTIENSKISIKTQIIHSVSYTQLGAYNKYSY